MKIHLHVISIEYLEMASLRPIQYTFAMFKPDIASNTIACKVLLDVIRDNGFRIIGIKNTRMNLKLAKEFYSEHECKFFYNRLVTFMSSSPIYALILAKEDAIANWRSLMGGTNVYKQIYFNPDCLRARFGLSDTRNAVHGSDSEDAFYREASFFFPARLLHKNGDIDNSSQ